MFNGPISANTDLVFYQPPQEQHDVSDNESSNEGEGTEVNELGPQEEDSEYKLVRCSKKAQCCMSSNRLDFSY